MKITMYTVNDIPKTLKALANKNINIDVASFCRILNERLYRGQKVVNIFNTEIVLTSNFIDEYDGVKGRD